MNENKKLLELIEWLTGEKYLIDENSTTMTEGFEKSKKFVNVIYAYPDYLDNFKLLDRKYRG